jgi:glutamine amidotransferase
MLGIVNYGAGNFRSVCNAFEYLDIPYKELSTSADFEYVTHIVLPGVGSFNDCVSRLKTLELFDILRNEINNKEKYFLGICVGHQILATLGTEFEEGEGMNIIPGKVVKFELSGALPVPHIGWTDVMQNYDDALFNNIDDGSTFYFVHSYYLVTDNSQDILATAHYGKEITVAVKADNVYGVQFHPEKSQGNGLQLLKNFSNLGN